MTEEPHDAFISPGPEAGKPEEPEIEEVMNLRDRILTPLVALDLVTQAEGNDQKVKAGLIDHISKRIAKNALPKDIVELCSDAYLDCKDLGLELASILTENKDSTMSVDHGKLNETARKLDAAIHVWIEGGSASCAGD